MSHQAILITTDGIVRRITIGEPIYQTAGQTIGGPIEIVRPGLLANYVLIVDEYGKLWGKPQNLIASAIYANPYEEIVGDVLIMKEGIVDGEPGIVGIDDDDVKNIVRKIAGVV